MKKRGLLALFAGLALATTMAAAAACTPQEEPPAGGGGQQGGQEQPSTPTPEQPTPDTPTTPDRYEITLGGGDNRSMDVGTTTPLTWSVTKNGTATEEDVLVTVSDPAIVRWNEEDGTVEALAEGRATVTVSLLSHPDVKATLTCNVVNYFFSREIQRGTVNLNNEKAGSVVITGGQATIVAKKAATSFVFRAKLTLPDNVNVGTTQSFGVGSFVNNGDNALWFGLRNDDGKNDGVFSVYTRNFYNGWGSATTDAIVKGYERADTGNTVEVEIVRNGGEYWYSVGGFYQKYTDNANYAQPTYPGIYSQEIAFTVSEFSVSYDEEEVNTAAQGYDSKAPAAVVINERNSRLLRGKSYPFTATVYPDWRADGAQITWELDKSGMTAGQEGTSVSNGQLTLAADAEGTVVLVAKSGTTETRHAITILTQPDEAENAQLSVKGGVQLNADGSIVFPEIMRDTDGVVNEQDYAASDYSATMKEQVKTNFSITFTVSDYVTTADFPKLQIALGGGRNNFYVVYKPDGTCRIEAFTGGVFNDGRFVKGWYNSESFTDFDRNAPHTYTISVAENGVYTVKVDGKALAFNMDGNAATLCRDYNAFTTQQTVKFATKGVSAKVSEIELVNGTDVSLPVFWTYNQNVTDIGEQGFTARYGITQGDVWQARDNYINGAIYTKGLAAASTLEFDAEFTDATEDTKLVVRIGNWEYHINNKLAGADGIQGSVYKDTWAGNFNVNVPGAGLKVHVRIERNNDAVRFILNDTVIEDVASGAPTATDLRFWILNGNAAYSDYTATVSNLTVGEYERLDLAQGAWNYSSDRYSDVTKTGFTVQAGQGGWENPTIVSTQQFAGNAEVSMNVAFSAAMRDGKFIVQLAGQRVMLNNKNGSLSITVNRSGEDWSETGSGVAGLALGLKIRRVGTLLQVYVNDVLKKTVTCDTSSTVAFFLFNEDANDAEVTATCSSFAISQYTQEGSWYPSNEANVTGVSEDGFVIRADNGGWGNDVRNSVHAVDALTGDVKVEFDLAFSAGMTDGKLIVGIGGQRVMINNKVAGGGSLSVTVNANGEDWSEGAIENENALTMHVRIERVGTTLTVYVNDAQVKQATCGAQSVLGFWIFNEKVEEADVTATVSNLVVTPIGA